MKDERLTPRIASTAKALYAVYFAFSILCFLAYRAVGLSWFEAWCHMATTMGLGGFSTWDDGFAHFDSVAVEMVAMVFMLIAGINFATHFNALRLRSARAYLQCPQAIPYLVIVVGVGLVISGFLFVKGCTRTRCRHCVMACSTPFPWAPPPATRTPTSRNGPCSRR